MRLASNQIAGYELAQQTAIAGTSISNGASAIGTASFRLFGIPAVMNDILKVGKSVDMYRAVSDDIGDAGIYGPGSVFGETTWGTGESVGDRIFTGRISNVEVTKSHTIKLRGTGINEYTISCQNHGILLSTICLSEPVTFTDKTDQEIIQTLFALYDTDGIFDLSGVRIGLTIDSITFDTISLKAVLDALRDRAGTEYYVDVANNVLNYHKLDAIDAPYVITDGDEGLSVYGEAISGETAYGEMPAEQRVALRDGFSYSENLDNPANYVLVKGTVEDDGSQVTAVVEDSASAALLGGVFSRVIVDRNIRTVEEATQRGQIELNRWARPRTSGAFTIRYEGLTVGQYLPVRKPSFNVSDSFFVRTVRLFWSAGHTDSRWSVEFGDARPDLEKMVQKATVDSQQTPYVPVTVGTTVPADGSITAASFASTIQPVHIVNTLPALPDTAYPNDSIVILTTNHKLYRNAAGVWTAEIPTSDLIGTISETQIADDSISTPKLQANSVTTFNLASSAVTTDKLAANSVIAGIIAVGAVAAGDIVAGQFSVGGPGMISQMRVFDTSGGLAAWIGDDTATSGYEGAWFKQLRVGGSAPGTALFVADSAGNLTISGTLIAGAVAVADTANLVNAANINGPITFGQLDGSTVSITNSMLAGGIDFAAKVDGSSVIISNSMLSGGIDFAAKVNGLTVSISNGQLAGGIDFAAKVDASTVSIVNGQLAGGIDFAKINGATVSITNGQLAGGIDFANLDSATVNITDSQIVGGINFASKIDQLTVSIVNNQLAGSIDWTKLDPSTVNITNAMLAGGIDFANIDSVTVSIANSQLAGGIDFATKVSAASVSITNSQLAGSINFSKLDGSSISITNSQLAGSIDFSKINGLTVSISGSQIGALTITASNLANATITGTKIASATITDANIADLSANKITAGTMSVGSGGLTVSGSGGLTIVVQDISGGPDTTYGFSNFTLSAPNIDCGFLQMGGAIHITIGGIRSGGGSGTQLISPAQGAAVADANTSNSTASFSDVNTALNAIAIQLNSFLSRIRSHGLIAT